MPVSISVRQLTDHDVSILATNNPFTELRTFTLDTPNYLVIKQHHSGVLDLSSPVAGLCTDTVASGLAIVFHCPTTSRSCLIHTPTSFKVASWAEQLSFVTAGAPAGTIMEVVVLKGSARRKSRLDHAETVGALEGGLRELARSMGIVAKFTYPEQKLTSGGVSVDKGTGRIEIFVLPSYFEPSQIALGEVDLAKFDALHRRTTTILSLAHTGGGAVVTAPFGEALSRVLSA